ncbi:MAG: PilZ domain-containing protein [Acidobacteriota bacterium]
MSEEIPQTRKAVRIPLSISVRVTGLDSTNKTFTEIMRTGNVSKIGAFLITERTLLSGAVLKIESANKKLSTNEEILAKVASVIPRKRFAGVGVKIIKGQDAWKELITSL